MNSQISETLLSPDAAISEEAEGHPPPNAAAQILQSRSEAMDVLQKETPITEEEKKRQASVIAHICLVTGRQGMTYQQCAELAHASWKRLFKKRKTTPEEDTFFHKKFETFDANELLQSFLSQTKKELRRSESSEHFSEHVTEATTSGRGTTDNKAIVTEYVSHRKRAVMYFVAMESGKRIATYEKAVEWILAEALRRLAKPKFSDDQKELLDRRIEGYNPDSHGDGEDFLQRVVAELQA